MRAFAAALGLLIAASPAAAQGAVEVVHFHGDEVRAPASWPVYRLAEHPGMCVRLDRRAVYLGTPAANQHCSANAIGRRRAILVDPGAAAGGARASLAGGAPSPGGSAPSSTAFTGLGFDSCTTPSTRTMSAWSDSPYRSLGIYLGGVNRACAQPNLTPRWTATEVAAGWHPIPLYVGLQAPTSGCGGCAKLSSSQATRQGTEAASDAVEDAGNAGIGPDNPIYFDMEGYARSASSSRATLTFLAAWTVRLHALGYVSGVYSSSASGIADLAGEIGSGYPEPDDVWTANWNGQANALDPYLSTADWPGHRRLHQYRGAHNETYGGVTINIDNDYVDGATVGAALAGPPHVPPHLPPLSVFAVTAAGAAVRVSVRCGWPSGETCPGQIVMRSRVRVPRRAGRRARVVRIAVARRAFRLEGGRSHTYRVALNSRGRPLLRASGRLDAQLVVAIPGARASRAVELRG